MESVCNYQFLEGKTILITGVTGFLGKVLVERILHVQPNIKKLFLVLRADDDMSARQRLMDEVIETELFKVLKEKWGANLVPLLAKVVPVCGDVADCDNLGIKNSEMRNEMWREIDIVVNSAATTNFYDRYDVALATNAFGAVNVLNFAKKCLKIQLLIHVSTAYVCGNKEGIVPEKSFQMGETLEGASASYLDIGTEKKLADERLEELRAQHATKKEITSAMKNLGAQRAALHGWPNTYTFTKAMGEMLLGQLKENLDVIILRPTIITSTIKDPFPGWIEGVRTMNGIFIGYGLGNLSFFIGDEELVIDLIPGDIVVNFILVVMAAHALQLHQPLIYHIGSSRKNPMTYADLYKFMFYYFTINPCNNNSGKPIEVRRVEVIKTMASFRKHVMVHLLPLVKIANLVNVVTCRHFEDQLNKYNRGFNQVMRLAEIYEPFVFFKGIFDDANTEKLLTMTRETNLDADIFSIDSKSIKWDEYFMNIHLHGVKKYLMKG